MVSTSLKFQTFPRLHQFRVPKNVLLKLINEVLEEIVFPDSIMFSAVVPSYKFDDYQ